MRLFYWVHRTGSAGGNTGVQRVVRNLAAELHGAGHELVPVRWRADLEAVVHAERAWLTGLAQYDGPVLEPHTQAGLPLHLARPASGGLDGCWLIVPEVLHVSEEGAPEVAVALDYARYHGLRTAAVFHDLIPLRRPGYERLAAGHARYAHALAAADVLLANSRHTADDIAAWWRAQGHDSSRLPPVIALPLPEQVRGQRRVTEPTDPPDQAIRFLSLGTIEPRKNQLTTLRAFARLTARRGDLDLRFDVVGDVHATVADEVRELVARVEGVHVHRYLPDDQVFTMIAAAHATVFTSLDEGYGLPIAESLWLGSPCLTSDHGAMAELASGGGCLTVDATDGEAIEQALERLAVDPHLRRSLAAQACARPLRTWKDYAEDVVRALEAVPAPARVAVLEGLQTGQTASAVLATSGASVLRLAWHADLRALVPAAGVPGAAVTSGHLAGGWAVIPARECQDDDALEMMAVAHGLGLRVALEASADTPLPLVAGADMTLLPDPAVRETVLDRALLELPKPLGVRDRLRVGTGRDALAALSSVRQRTAAAGVLRWPERICLWAGRVSGEQRSEVVDRPARLLLAALHRRRVEVMPLGWDPATGRTVVLDLDLSRDQRGGAALPDDLAGTWMLLPAADADSADGARRAKAEGMRCAALWPDRPGAAAEPHRSCDDSAALEQVRLVLPTSWTAAAALTRSLRHPGGAGRPSTSIVPCLLGADGGGTARALAPAAAPGLGAALRLVAVDVRNPHEDYPRLLDALARARTTSTRPLSLTLIGRQAQHAQLAEDVTQLARSVGAELLDGEDHTAVRMRCESAHLTVIGPSTRDAGLPVLESLWRGRPAVVHRGSSAAELVTGGGVLAVDMTDDDAFAQALVRFGDEDDGLLETLSQEAVKRPLRTWDDCAEDVLLVMARSSSPPGWPLPAVVRRRPLLTCAIPTHNGSSRLQESLPRLLEATRPWRDVVEVVVCDGASTDDTPRLFSALRGEPGFRSFRSRSDRGDPGLLATAARMSRGAFVWLLGDDDLLIDGALENVLEGLAAHPDVEMVHLDRTRRSQDRPGWPAEAAAQDVLAGPAAGPSRHVEQLREIAGFDESLFTVISSCVLRRDHALRAHQAGTLSEPSSLETDLPSAVYILNALQDRPAWWVGEPAVAVAGQASWGRREPLRHLERMPALYELAEQRGVDAERLDVHRSRHLAQAEQWANTAYFDADPAVRAGFSMGRLLERCKHLPELRERHLTGLRLLYAQAWGAGRVVADDLPPDELFSRYGL